MGNCSMPRHRSYAIAIGVALALSAAGLAGAQTGGGGGAGGGGAGGGAASAGGASGASPGAATGAGALSSPRSSTTAPGSIPGNVRPGATGITPPTTYITPGDSTTSQSQTREGGSPAARQGPIEQGNTPADRPPLNAYGLDAQQQEQLRRNQAGGGGTRPRQDTGGTSIAECMDAWSPSTHMSKEDFRRGCERTLENGERQVDRSVVER